MTGNYDRQKRWRDNHQKVCKCGNSMYYRSTQCKECHTVGKSEKLKLVTLGEFRKKYKNSGKHPSWMTSEIRQFARVWNNKMRELPCQNCGYNKHVELAHMFPISKFSDSSTLGEINSPQNILVLCPNCHWEFDNLSSG